jgi:hypothetical protein
MLLNISSTTASWPGAPPFLGPPGIIPGRPNFLGAPPAGAAPPGPFFAEAAISRFLSFSALSRAALIFFFESCSNVVSTTLENEEIEVIRNEYIFLERIS